MHAEGQVVNFHINSKIPFFKIEQGLNCYLPDDLAVIAAEEVSPKFHAQFSAKWKVYEYRILNSKTRSPLERFRAFHVPHPLSLLKMKRAARLFCGRHDFRAFESSGSRRKSAVRTIRQLSVQKKGREIVLTVTSNGFLYKMVRSMVGTLVEVGAGKLGLTDLKQIFTLKKRELVGATAPPQGLVLKRVIY